MLGSNRPQGEGREGRSENERAGKKDVMRERGVKGLMCRNHVTRKEAKERLGRLPAVQEAFQ